MMAASVAFPGDQPVSVSTSREIRAALIGEEVAAEPWQQTKAGLGFPVYNG